MKVRKTRYFMIAALVFWGISLSTFAACDSENKNGQGDGATESHDGEKHDEHAHEGKDGDKDHDEHDEGVVRLSEGELKEFGVTMTKAGSGKLSVYVTLPGEVNVNEDRMAHIVPRVSGVVREVRKSLGDKVRRGEVIAVIESRELSDAKAEYLAAYERISLARSNYAREERLWRKKVSSEQDYLSAKKDLAEGRIALRSGEQKLHALGFSDQYLKQLLKQRDITFTRYEIIAPFKGTVIEKHIALGEAVESNTGMFVVADLSSVWINLSVYQKDLPFVRKGASVTITAGHGIPDTIGAISYVGPIVGEKTRTALARVVLPNKDGIWRPGLFISGKISVDEALVPVIAPKTALQTYENQTIIFVKSKGGFKPTPVVIGRSDEASVEIISGLKEGEKYVTTGAFTLKAQLSKGAFGSGHHH